MDDLIEVGAEPPAKRICMRPNRDVLEKYMLVDIDKSLRAVKAAHRGLRCIDSAELTLADFNSGTSVHSVAKKTTSPSSPYLSQAAEHLRSAICRLVTLHPDSKINVLQCAPLKTPYDSVCAVWEALLAVREQRAHWMRTRFEACIHTDTLITHGSFMCACVRAYLFIHVHSGGYQSARE